MGKDKHNDSKIELPSTAHILLTKTRCKAACDDLSGALTPFILKGLQDIRMSSFYLASRYKDSSHPESSEITTDFTQSAINYQTMLSNLAAMNIDEARLEVETMLITKPFLPDIYAIAFDMCLHARGILSMKKQTPPEFAEYVRCVYVSVAQTIQSLQINDSSQLLPSNEVLRKLIKLYACETLKMMLPLAEMYRQAKVEFEQQYNCSPTSPDRTKDDDEQTTDEEAGDAGDAVVDTSNAQNLLENQQLPGPRQFDPNAPISPLSYPLAVQVSKSTNPNDNTNGTPSSSSSSKNMYSMSPTPSPPMFSQSHASSSSKQYQRKQNHRVPPRKR